MTADTARLWPAVAVTRPIDAAATEVWDVISAPGNLEPTHPFCARNPVESWPGVGSRDTIHYLSGWVYERACIAWHDGVGYDLEVGGEGEQPSRVTWRIAAVSPTSSTLTITIRPRSIDRVPGIAQALVQRTYVRRQLRSYLESVVCGIEWFVTTGDPVPRNQFGRHRWFSDAPA